MFVVCLESLTWVSCVVLATSALLGGCASGSGARAGPMFQPPSELETAGDWDDLGASVQVGAEQSEMAVLHGPREAGASPVQFDLLTNLHEPVRLEAWRASERIRLRAGVGRFGDQGRERALLRNIARRLEDLKGVEFAPVRE